MRFVVEGRRRWEPANNQQVYRNKTKAPHRWLLSSRHSLMALDLVLLATITLYESLKLFICYYKVHCSNRYYFSYTPGCA